MVGRQVGAYLGQWVQQAGGVVVRESGIHSVDLVLAFRGQVGDSGDLAGELA